MPLPVFRHPSGAILGGVPLQGRCPCLYSVAPPGLFWVGCLYRGDAPACIPSPLRGYCGWDAFTGALPLPVFRCPSGAILGGVHLQGRCPCLYSVAPPGLLWVGCLYRGDAPARTIGAHHRLLLPLRGFYLNAKAPEGRWNTGRGATPVHADGRKAPEGRRTILPFQGQCPCQDDWCSPSASVAPPGLLLN